jgi:1-acyl-sn-glycerol-3-phosphate acyltransferase
LSGEGCLIIYRVCCGIVRFLIFFLWRWDVKGLENFPAEGPVIVVANHISYWDPVLIACALPRQVFFMGKKEIFSIPVLGCLLKSIGVFPVDRLNPDRGTIRHTRELLQQGQVVGIFPEGTRSKTGLLLSPSTGAAYFATRTGTQVCPMAMVANRGASSWGLWRRLSLNIGPCISFDSNQKHSLESVVDQMMLKIQELLDSYNK